MEGPYKGDDLAVRICRGRRLRRPALWISTNPAAAVVDAGALTTNIEHSRSYLIYHRGGGFALESESRVLSGISYKKYPKRECD